MMNTLQTQVTIPNPPLGYFFGQDITPNPLRCAPCPAAWDRRSGRSYLVVPFPNQEQMLAAWNALDRLQALYGCDTKAEALSEALLIAEAEAEEAAEHSANHQAEYEELRAWFKSLPEVRAVKIRVH